MKVKTIALVVASAFALGACSKDPQHASIGVQADIKRGTGVGSEISSQVGESNDTKAGNTFTGAVAARNIIVKMFKQLALEQGSDHKVDFLKISPKGLFRADEYGPSAPKEGKGGERPTPAEYQRDQMISIISGAMSPIASWPSLTKISRESYMYGAIAADAFSKNVFALLYPSVPPETARNPEFGLKAVREAWETISTKELCSIWEKSIKEVDIKFDGSDAFRLDWSGSTSPVSFQVGEIEVTGDKSGLSYWQSGIPMFTEDSINGIKIEIAMDRGNSTTATVGYSSSRSSKSESGKSVTGSAGLSSQ